MGKHSIYKSEKGKRVLQNHYDSYIRSFDINFEHVYIDTRFGRTHLLQAGPKDGKPLIILQGGNCVNPMSLSWFTPLFDEFRVYAPDTIGHPGYSEETRVSAKDESLALWVLDLMGGLHIAQSAFIGPSYGAGIILRLASYMPDKIACAVLVSPSGIGLGSKITMVNKVLIPMLLYRLSSSNTFLRKVADAMSMGSMDEIDRTIIGAIFKHVRLEQDMPKLTHHEELRNYSAPTLLIAGRQDIFFPGERIVKRAKEIIPNLTSANLYNMGHFPFKECLLPINQDIKRFLEMYY